MTEVELELTYLAKALPKDLASSPSKLVIDQYYPPAQHHPVVRLRQNGDKYEMTKKTMANGTDSSHMIEETIHLTADEYISLAIAPGKRVAKRRYLYNFQGRTLEIDVFQEDLSGLVIIDAEFTSREDQNAFMMPEFCLVDVTQDEFTAGGVLAGKKFADLADTLQKTYGYQPLYMEK